MIFISYNSMDLLSRVQSVHITQKDQQETTRVKNNPTHMIHIILAIQTKQDMC